MAVMTNRCQKKGVVNASSSESGAEDDEGAKDEEVKEAVPTDRCCGS